MYFACEMGICFMNETHDRHLHMAGKKVSELDQILCEHIMHETRGKFDFVV